MDDRRRHPRVSVNRRALVRATEGAAVSAQLVDISVCGLGLLYPRHVAPGAALAVQFQLGVRGRFVDLALKGVVRHTHIKGNALMVGIELVELSAEAYQTISAFVQQKLEIYSQTAGASPPPAAPGGTS